MIKPSDHIHAMTTRTSNLDYQSTEFTQTLDKIIRTRLLRRAQQAIIEETAQMVDQNNSPVIIVHQIAEDLMRSIEKLMPLETTTK